MSSPFGTPHPIGPVSQGPALPTAYGVTRLTLLPRDPDWMHAYWEIASYTWQEAEKVFGRDVLSQGRSVVRLYNMDNGSSPVDVEVELAARNWYLRSPANAARWRAELGLVLPDGRFVVLAASNVIQMPAGRVSEDRDEKWGVLKAEWDRLFALSGGGKLGAGSIDITRMLAARWEHFRGLSSGMNLSGSLWRPAPPAGKKFWLIADAEVIIHLATEPDARVTLQGQSVTLRPDGSYSIRLPLPDGEQRFPVHATNRDGDLSEYLEITVSRKTQGAG